MSGADLRALSIEIEQRSGHDSIPTIEDHYRIRRFEDGRYIDTATFRCVVPGCRYRRRDAEKMWLHVHGTHGDPPEGFPGGSSTEGEQR